MMTLAMAATYPEDSAVSSDDDTQEDQFLDVDSDAEAGTSVAVENRNTAVQQAKKFYRKRKE